ncbi:fumarylacetoacetate hydrolase family protein [Streptomyces sp. NPDC046805]|uniref:fumarylacetoacetate hydrolase family protein n=1 Tax=Streptomyces sp. NPDC046805 TaxID=3155134 RepID=UPI0033CBC8EF
MRIARLAHADGVDYAVLDGQVAELIADPFAEPAATAPYTARFSPSYGSPAGRPLRRLGRRVALADARLLAPVVPRTVVGMAHNTGLADRLRPPQAFLKPPRSVVGPGVPVRLPAGSERVEAEAELAVVLAASLTGHTEQTVHEAVFGYTIANDVTSRDLQQSDPLWTSAKSGHGFTPLGPWIETDLDATDVEVRLSIDGVELSPGSTAHLARGVAEILCHLAGYLPLGPGDVVLTGAPGETGPLRAGGSVSASAPAIGTLANPVGRAPDRHVPTPIPSGDTACP